MRENAIVWGRLDTDRGWVTVIEWGFLWNRGSRELRGSFIAGGCATLTYTWERDDPLLHGAFGIFTIGIVQTKRWSSERRQLTSCVRSKSGSSCEYEGFWSPLFARLHRTCYGSSKKFRKRSNWIEMGFYDYFALLSPILLWNYSIFNIWPVLGSSVVIYG